MPEPRIELHLMTHEQYQAYLAEDIPRYADENVQAGFWTEEDALRLADETFERHLPQGVDTPGQRLFHIVDAPTGAAVGMVWFGLLPGGVSGAGFVYNLFIEEPHRRKGYARQAMVEVERHAQMLSWSTLGLHVFGHNTGARQLYTSLGYDVRSMNMVKTIADVVHRKP